MQNLVFSLGHDHLVHISRLMTWWVASVMMTIIILTSLSSITPPSLSPLPSPSWSSSTVSSACPLASHLVWWGECCYWEENSWAGGNIYHHQYHHHSCQHHHQVAELEAMVESVPTVLIMSFALAVTGGKGVITEEGEGDQNIFTPEVTISVLISLPVYYWNF